MGIGPVSVPLGLCRAGRVSRGVAAVSSALGWLLVSVATSADSVRKSLITSATMSSASESVWPDSYSAADLCRSMVVPFGLDGPVQRSTLPTSGEVGNPVAPSLSGSGNITAYSLWTMRLKLSKPKPLGRRMAGLSSRGNLRK